MEWRHLSGVRYVRRNREREPANPSASATEHWWWIFNPRLSLRARTALVFGGGAALFAGLGQQPSRGAGKPVAAPADQRTALVGAALRAGPPHPGRAGKKVG